MEKLFNTLGWTGTASAFYLNIMAIVTQASLNELLTVIISALTIMFLCIKVTMGIMELVDRMRGKKNEEVC